MSKDRFKYEVQVAVEAVRKAQMVGEFEHEDWRVLEALESCETQLLSVRDDEESLKAL